MVLHFSAQNTSSGLQKKFREASHITAKGNRGSAYSQKYTEEYMCHTRIMNSGLVAATIVDTKYPSNAAFALLTKGLELFTTQYSDSQWAKEKEGYLPVTGMADVLKEYADATAVDKISAIQQDLNETKVILQDNIANLMERGDQLENLETTVESLEHEAKVMRTQAEEINTCCCCKCACLANIPCCASCSRCTIL